MRTMKRTSSRSSGAGRPGRCRRPGTTGKESVMPLPDGARTSAILASGWALLASCAGIRSATPPDAGAAPDRPSQQHDGGSCTPVECVLANGRYCGPIGDGCNGTKDCGACPAEQVCEK